MSGSTATFRLDLGKRIKALRKEAGLNQDELASRIGITKGTLSRYERGDLSPTAEVLASLTRNLGANVTADMLLFEKIERTFPLTLDNFGTVVIQGEAITQGETCMVLDSSDAIQFFGGCIDYEKSRPEPTQEIIDILLKLRSYFLNEGVDLKMLTKTLITK